MEKGYMNKTEENTGRIDYELLIEDYISHDQAGEVEAWAACRAAWMLYDCFPDRASDITEALTSQCHKSSTAIYSRRDAFEEYRVLYPDLAERELPDLSYSHYARLRHLRFARGDEPGVVPLADNQARQYLEAAQAASWSVDTMIHQILSDAVLEGRTNGVELQRRRFEAWIRKGKKLIEGDVPQVVRIAVANALEVVEGWLK